MIRSPATGWFLSAIDPCRVAQLRPSLCTDRSKTPVAARQSHRFASDIDEFGIELVEDSFDTRQWSEVGQAIGASQP